MVNVKSWLEALNFKNNQEIYELVINSHKIEVDYKNKKIKYPSLKEIGRHTTTNFSSKENFVVLEIIIGLLKQGYLPSQISIEKGYKLGHNTKSGNADVTVEDNDGNPFLIIEAKTFGNEFEKEWKNTLTDGGQLFSYEKQENKAKVLVLYASEVIENKINRIYRAIILKDNESFLSTLDNPRGYKNARGGNDKFEIWRDTYQYDYVTNGILEETVKTFEINKVKSSIDDLKLINHDEVQKKYNQFATILRKFNIGGHENAFDKLVNLFLTKIVDEQQNKKDLQFNWKGVANDTYFELVDRLQKLYQVGMEKFLNEKVSYVAEKDVENAFRLRKDAAKDAILKYFKELKYFSNNDFTFLDVYNEQLFYQNSKILVEVVQMLQDMKLRTNEQNQFLGDLFEGFLDNGVKQSEGQFFTPLPIVKFIVSSLPVKEINENINIPKVIDYACGAGHFLNEYAEQLKEIVDKDKIKDYYESIYGIEKEYRLSKVAKVSAFMYGQDDINIIYGDGLTEHNQINEGGFSVLIANPPYSVKGFLETLSDKDRSKYELSKSVDKLDTNNSIELFFIERAIQLLKPEGISAIIVPISILSNGNLYIKARKMLLENFEIIAIVEFGSKTFGSTGTNTATLFLRKKKYPPKESDNYKYAVERWFKGVDVLDSDIEILEKYCIHNEYDYNTYLEIQKGILKDILNIDLFKEYKEDFKNSKIYKNILKKKTNSKYSLEMKNAEIEKALFNYIRETEQEKVYYFALANSQKTKVVVVKTPTENNQMKQFLGYEWSKRKGNEGIKYLGSNISDEEMEISKNQALNSIKTPLFNPLDLKDNSKINTIIRNNFKGFDFEIPLELHSFVSKFLLLDMLDFKQIDFDAQIKTSVERNFEVTSKYPLKKLSEVIYSLESGSRPKGGVSNFKHGAYTIGGEHIDNNNGRLNLKNIKYVPIDFFKKSVKGIIKKNDILLCKDGALTGKVCIIRDELDNIDAMINEHVFIIRCKNLITQLYLFNILYSTIGQEFLKNNISGAAQGGINSTNLQKIKIPVPPISIQEKLISEVEKLDEQYENSRMKIEEYRNQIDEIFRNLEIVGEYRLSDLKIIFNPNKSEVNDILDIEVSFIPMQFLSEEGKIISKETKNISELKKGSYKYFKDNDVLIAKITPCMENGKCAIAKNLTNGIGFGSSEYHVFRCNQEIILPEILFGFLNRDSIRKSAEKVMTGSSGHRRVPISFYENLKINLPSLEEQRKIITHIREIEELIEYEKNILNNTLIEKERVINKYLY